MCLGHTAIRPAAKDESGREDTQHSTKELQGDPRTRGNPEHTRHPKSSSAMALPISPFLLPSLPSGQEVWKPKSVTGRRGLRDSALDRIPNLCT